jgi:two-component system cell cycle sensor histidine kinase/response regulator CckA
MNFTNLKNSASIVVYVGLICSACTGGLRSPMAVDGVLDLSGWDFHADGPVELAGDWEFYWGEHISPSEFAKAGRPGRTALMRLPRVWNGYRIEGRKLGGDGYATFRLRVVLNQPAASLALKIPDLLTAYTLYINGREVARAGVAGTNFENTIPQWLPQVADFRLPQRDLDFVVHLSNFHHPEGGMSKAILLGDKDQITNAMIRKRGFEIFLSGSLFIMGLYHLGLFGLRRRDPSPLVFSVFCLLLALYALLTGEIFFCHLFPNIDWEVLVRLIYLSFYLTVPVFYMFIHALYPQESSRRYLHAIWGLCLVFSIFVLATPAKTYLPSVKLYHVLTLITGFYITYILTVAYRRKRESVLLFFAGFSILFLCVINDILYNNRIVHTGDLAPLALFVFTFFQAILLSRRFSNAFTTIENQHELLADLNTAHQQEIVEHKRSKEELIKYRDRLEDLVTERTGALTRINVQLQREIKERMQAEEALRESESRYRSIFENIIDMYYCATMEGDLLDVSPSGARLLKYETASDLIRKSLVRDLCVHPQDGEAILDKLRAQGRLINHEVEFKRSDGTPVAVEANFHVIYNESGTPTEIEGMIRDITQRRKDSEAKRSLQEKLARSQKMEALGLLASGVAHDLNNVLSGIVSYPDLMLMDMPEEDPMRPLLLTIRSCGEKAAAIIQDLVSLARRGITTPVILNLNDVVRSFLDSPEHQRLRSRHPSMRIETQLDPNLLYIKGSADQLQKTVLNLITNAAEAQPGGGLISVKTENRHLDRPLKGYDTIREGDFVLLSVSDRGGALSSEEMDRIFEPFYTKRIMGRRDTGLGLAVVWGAVQDHGGYLNVDSAPDSGTSFDLYFPATRETPAEEVQAKGIEHYLGQGETILVVDDVNEQRDIAADLLTRLGYSVETAASGEEAVDYLKNRGVDLIVLDMVMDPGIDGLETFRRIKLLHPNQRAVIASGYSETDRVKEAQRLGAGAYVKKPYTLEKIAMAIWQELHGPAANRKS